MQRHPRNSGRFFARPRARRGVLILVVLSLLALFLMVGVAFVLTTGQFHSMSQRRSTAGIYFSDPVETLDAGMYEVLRGTTNVRSSIRGHDLLNDHYGNDGFFGTIGTAAVVSNTGGVFINIPVSAVESATDGRTHALSTTRGAYAGCVFTVVSGSEVGRSTRIVGYDGAGTLTVMNWETRNGRTANAANLAGSRFVVNGRPFNGMGAGYNQTTGKGNRLDNVGSLPSALRPNRSTKLTTFAPNPSSTAGLLDPYFFGGMDESYDAADFQNMFLAYVPANASETTPAQMIIPSFHRPALFSYWQTTAGTNPNYARATMRPLPGNRSDEDSFTALPVSTHTTDELTKFTTGPWDVDNDGDNIRDSVWVDLGFPDITSPEGYLCRPLFAFLIRDLDGRLNLNANGNNSHLESLPTAVTLANSTSSANAPRGEGFSVAEINLAGGTFASPILPTAQYQALLRGNSNWPGRYGSGTDISPGITGQWEKTSQHNLFGMPTNYYTLGPFTANLLGRPIDVRGRTAFGLDDHGAPVYETSTATDDRIDSPGEMDLSWRTPRGVYGGRSDAPFSIHEQERLLRAYDQDSTGLPNRILGLAPNIAINDLRHMFTTDSFSYNGPMTSSPASARGSSVTYGTQFGASGSVLSIPYSIADMMKQRLVAAGVNATTANNEILKMLPPELLRGERFNVNRLFGNGGGANNENIVTVFDDPSEPPDQLSYHPTYGSSVTPAYGSSVNVNIDYSNGDSAIASSIANTPHAAKQIFARHLFCMAMLLREPGANIDFDGDSSNNSLAETTRGLAQWAINVVDFRDPDSIMTPFEYDTNPLNGWNVDGDLTTSGEAERGVVWGAERPELLLTETIAWHDRATEDTDDDPTTLLHAVPVDPLMQDPSFDQRFRPKGTAFIELYNPWVGGDKYPAELYSNVSGQAVLNLDRRSGGTSGSPVWRVLVVEGDSRVSLAAQDATTNVSNYDPESILDADVERSIYFTSDTTSYSTITGHGTPYTPSTASNGSTLEPIRPGSYAVIGSKGRQGDSSTGFKSTAGLSVTADDPYVVLHPSAGVANRVKVRTTKAGTVQTTPYQKTAIVIDTPRSFSVSEPDGVSESYYADNVTDATDGTTMSIWTDTIAPEGEYVPPIDQPLDAARANNDSRWDALLEDGTTEDFRTIHLQRLANPLLAWNATTNPYITIDVSAMNLTAFNGAPTTTADPDVTVGTSTNGNFASLQRGNSEPLTGTGPRTLWSHELSDLPVGTAPSALTLKHSLGFLSENYGTPSSQGFPDSTSGNMFPWLTWNNRPFLSPYELMLVPRSRASRLAFDYTPLPTTPSVSLPAGFQSEYGVYGHLLNFFDSRTGATPGPHLYRLFEYVGVPSPFAGVYEMLNPSLFAANTAPAGFRVPMNFVSTQREPGRININTITDGNIWNAILGNHPGPSWADIVSSRRGYGLVAAPILSNSTTVPTFFGNPFRAFGSGDLVPLSTMEKSGIEASLLRSQPDTLPAGIHPSGSAPLLRPQTSSKYNQADRNPYFRYQQASRISNLVTTQSNVYAVWVTMSYFAVQPGQTPRLMTEIGNSESGGERHRAFYIIDRSIPVAFEPGVNHNVDDAILVRRLLD